MKKALLRVWDFLHKIRSLFSDLFFSGLDFFYKRLNKPPKVMTNMETIEKIIAEGLSVSRFGDAEIKLAAGKGVNYQVPDPQLAAKLRQVLSSEDERLLVCIPDVFESLSLFTPADGAYWVKHLARYRKYWYRFTLKNKVYGNAFISRVYMCFNEKHIAAAYFDALKKIWDNKDVVLVEGEKSRLGVGNDLFDNAKSLRRILGPSARAFSRYSDLLAEIRKVEKSALLILAMGPVASVLPFDLLQDGYRSIDLGNIDTEYEWFLRGYTKKMPVENKMVYEAGAGEGVGELEDETYQSQIIARVL